MPVKVGSVYIDFTKAHHFIGNVKGNGPNSELMDWFSSYLSNRSQVVVISRSTSHRIHPTSGVQQGAVLVSILFLIFINEWLSSLPTGSEIGFADDLKIFRVINTECD